MSGVNEKEKYGVRGWMKRKDKQKKNNEKRKRPKRETPTENGHR